MIGKKYFRLQLKKHVKRSPDSPGGIVTLESPIHMSNVALLDPVSGWVPQYCEESAAALIVSQ